MRATRKACALLMLLGALALPAYADCDRRTWNGCTARDVYDDAFERAILGADEAIVEARAATEENLDEAAAKVDDAPAAATAPSSFAGRIHGSYEDFLKLLAFAVNDVEESEDGKALIVRLNPLRKGRHRLGLTLTVAEPEIGEAVRNAISVDGRADTVGLLEKELDDFDDLTLAAAYSLFTEKCTLAQVVKKRCYGRDKEAYVGLLSDLIAAPPSTSFESSRQVLALFPGVDLKRGVFSGKLSADEDARARQVEALQELAQHDVNDTRDHLVAMKAAGNDLFWPLIDNQPQVAFTVSTRSAANLVDQEYESVALELQFGGANVNSVFRGCAEDEPSCPRARLARIAAEKARPGAKLSDGKWVLSGTYLERKSYAVAVLPIEEPPGEFTPFDLADSSELKLELQWGALISTSVDGWTPRVDFSAEGLETRDDGIRTKSRWVATATLTLPIAEGVTIPVSLNYANKPEFLGERDESLGAHVGLSYKLPFGDGK